MLTPPPPPSVRGYIRKLFVRPLWALGHKCHFLKDNFLWRSIKPYYHLYVGLRDFSFVGDDAVSFYLRNAERVNAVANALADEKSKRIYLGLIKFRQTRSNRDFPFHAIGEEQYFFKELKLGENEVFIDCGAFIGDTIDPFLRRCRKYRQIIAFEPDPVNFEKLKNKYGNNSKITLINAGVHDKDGEISFSGEGWWNSKIADGVQGGAATSIPVRAIDSVNPENVSFIKMDIEGAELKALKGAEKTILRDKPKLAICIYHGDEDMIGIAEYIHRLVPEYKLYVRHYGLVTETVLYAVMPY